MQAAVRGKEWVDQAVARALRTMNVPTRTEFKRAVARIDALERELADTKRQAAAAAAAARPRAAARRRRSAAPPRSRPRRDPPSHRRHGHRVPARVPRAAAPGRGASAREPRRHRRGRASSRAGRPHRRIDFTEPASDQRLLELLREEEVETVVHAAFFTSPRRDTATRTSWSPSAPSTCWPRPRPRACSA